MRKRRHPRVDQQAEDIVRVITEQENFLENVQFLAINRNQQGMTQL